MPYVFNPFTGTFDATGAGVPVVIGPFDNTSTPKGLFITGTVLVLHAADATNPGGVSVASQTFAGDKTFSGIIYAAGGLDVATTGGTDVLNIGQAGADVINIGNIGSTVNINGTLAYINTVDLQVNDKLITINKGGAAGSAALSGIEIEENSTITGYLQVDATRNKWVFKAPNSANLLTADLSSANILLNQSVATTSSPSFVGVTLSGLTTGIAHVGVAGLISSSLIVDADVNAAAAIALSKLASVTANRALQSDGSGVISASAVTNTELGYVSGVTSAIQTQINGKVAKAGDTMTGQLFIDGSSDVVQERVQGTAGQTAHLQDWEDSSNTILASVSAAGVITGANLSGTNTGDVTLTAVGASPNGNAASLSGQALTLQPADNTNPGVLTAIAQNIGGAKTFSANLNVSGATLSSQAATSGISLITKAAATTPGDLQQWQDSSAAVLSKINATGDATLVSSTLINVTANRALVSDAAKKVISSATTDTEIGYVSGVTSSIQTQLNAKVVGPASATDNAVARYDGTTGKLIQDSLVSIDDAGNITATNLSGTNTGDILFETSFSAANNQVAAANVTGLSFSNATIRSFEVLLSVAISATSSLYEVFKLQGIQKSASWEMSVTSTGDNSGVNFSITNAGVVQYTSGNSSGFVSNTMKFKYLTTSV